MTTTALTQAAGLPQTPPGEAASLATEQLTAYVAELRALDPADWSKPTDCSRWDVRQIAAHIAGELDESAHFTVLTRHLHRARKQRNTGLADAINEQQQADRKHRSGPAIVSEIERKMPRAVRRRLQMPGLVRRIRVPGDDLPAGSDFGYLFDVIYPRDVWLHRIDTARATGHPLHPTAGESAIIAQVVRDLARSRLERTWGLDLDEVGHVHPQRSTCPISRVTGRRLSQRVVRERSLRITGRAQGQHQRMTPRGDEAFSTALNAPARFGARSAAPKQPATGPPAGAVGRTRP